MLKISIKNLKNKLLLLQHFFCHKLRFIIKILYYQKNNIRHKRNNFILTQNLSQDIGIFFVMNSSFFVTGVIHH